MLVSNCSLQKELLVKTHNAKSLNVPKNFSVTITEIVRFLEGGFYFFIYFFSAQGDGILLLYITSTTSRVLHTVCVKE